MKIFGKRKSTKAVLDTLNTETTSNESSSQAVSSPPDAAPPPADTNIPSYFTNTDDEPKKKKKKKNVSNEINGEEIDKLLEMDYESLNSKQRRLVRRHRERLGEDVDADNTTAAAAETPDSSKGHADTNHNNKNTRDQTQMKAADKSSEMNQNEKELLARLDGLNSKDRRKFLRQLRTDNPNNVDIDKLEEEAKRIAERNIREFKDEKQISEKKEAKQAPPQQQQPNPKSSSKKKRKSQDLSHLPPEEIARREKQRQLQIEAAERRARGEDLNNGHAHPLNSERRRANRRKPARKSQSNSRREFNSVGYRMRKNG